MAAIPSDCAVSQHCVALYNYEFCYENKIYKCSFYRIFLKFKDALIKFILEFRREYIFLPKSEKDLTNKGSKHFFITVFLEAFLVKDVIVWVIVIWKLRPINFIFLNNLKFSWINHIYYLNIWYICEHIVYSKSCFYFFCKSYVSINFGLNWTTAHMHYRLPSPIRCIRCSELRIRQYTIMTIQTNGNGWPISFL